ncbi:probable Bax inhibitor 1 [Uloborus diversus]|uniref:probable Bax inhibitor 1 n=1 Tax=Uloborus diversus TaxID=327109 RepID=UPI0024094F42|nr:probable Bax inhibitor 1 [Uloborus diversus]
MATQFDMNTFFRTLNQKMEPPLQTHMKNVYSCVALSTLAAAVGSFVHLFTGILSGGLLSSLGSVGFMIALMSTPDDGKNTKKRLGFLLAFAFLSGLGLGPLLDVVISINPAIIPTAFFSTCLIFACFTFASMFSNQRQFIYLGGSLMSLLSVMMTMALLNIFMGSYMLFKIQIYLGLLVMCAFILYDTQVILEKRRNGDKDYIWHSICLFIDLVQIFRYLLVILADKDSKKKK